MSKEDLKPVDASPKDKKEQAVVEQLRWPKRRYFNAFSTYEGPTGVIVQTMDDFRGSLKKMKGQLLTYEEVVDLNNYFLDMAKLERELCIPMAYVQMTKVNMSELRRRSLASVRRVSGALAEELQRVERLTADLENDKL